MYSVIPMTGIPNNKFSAKIYVDSANITLSFMLKYNDLAKYWVLDIMDSSGKYYISGLPLIPAQNVLEQFSYLGIGSARIVPKSKVSEQWPSIETLTSNWYVIWGDTIG